MSHLQIHPADNVAVALETGVVPAGHKIALHPIPAGHAVIKYGHPIGIASRDIVQGEHVHTHNLSSSLTTDIPPSPSQISNFKSQILPSSLTFNGYLRPDGRVATRNDIWIINTVGCVNRASELIAAACQDLVTDNIDGIHSFPHPFGCSQLGDDLSNTQKILAGLINHPNAGAVLVLGLGCENNQMRLLLDRAGTQTPGRVQYFNAQEVSDEVAAGRAAIQSLSNYARQFHRQPAPIADLTLALKCGGSDGFSGITANPLVGRIADLFTSAGATAILSEVPEMFGAEPALLQRAANPAVFQDTINLVNDFRAYFRRHNQPIDENPSPGNKEGGITTLAEKSLGCIQKGGHAPIQQVLPYGTPAPPRLAGLALVNSPGNDGVSSTAMTVAGATLLLFTTGRGTPMGFPIPTLKISSNSTLATRKPQWIDFDAGPPLTTTNPNTLTDQLLELILTTANGAKTRNEQNGYREIAIWKDGVTL